MSNVVALGASKANRFVLSEEQDAFLEHMTEEVDQIIKYALIERREILAFLRQKFFKRGQPFKSLPHVAWAEQKAWGVESLRIHLIMPIYRLDRTSEDDKYALLGELYKRVRDRMRPPMVIRQSVSA